MKKVLINIILITLILDVIGPLFFYIIFGFNSIYYSVDEKYIYYSAFFLTIVLLVLLFVLLLKDRKNGKIALDNINGYMTSRYIEYLFWLTIILSVITNIYVGGFSGTLGGKANSTIFSYLLLILDPRLLFFCVLLRGFKYQKKKYIVFYSTIYVLYSILNSSRSGAFWVVFYLIIFINCLELSPKFRRELIRFVSIPVLLSPVLFIAATYLRNGANSSLVDSVRLIVGRLSYLEVSGIEMHQHNEYLMNSIVFKDKYSFKNQIAQIVNQMIPGSIFQEDVQANQYWRAVYMNCTVDFCKNNYTSMYSILPTYFCVKYGFLISFILMGVITLFIYKIMNKIKNKVMAIFVGSYVFYTIFQFFDWSYHFQDILCFILTAGNIYVFSLFFGYKNMKVNCMTGGFINEV